MIAAVRRVVGVDANLSRHTSREYATTCASFSTSEHLEMCRRVNCALIPPGLGINAQPDFSKPFLKLGAVWDKQTDRRTSKTLNAAYITRGVATGGYIGIYTPQISLP